MISTGRRPPWTDRPWLSPQRAELGSGMWSFGPHDHPHPRGGHRDDAGLAEITGVLRARSAVRLPRAGRGLEDDAQPTASSNRTTRLVEAAPLAPTVSPLVVKLSPGGAAQAGASPGRAGPGPPNGSPARTPSRSARPGPPRRKAPWGNLPAVSPPFGSSIPFCSFGPVGSRMGDSLRLSGRKHLQTVT